MPRPLYLILDTESTLCKRRRRRILVSVAYEVTAEDGTVHESQYGIVRQPPDLEPDERSLAVHGIAPASSWGPGQPLADILQELFGCVRRNDPVAVVGHDVVGDVSLLVSEAVHAGLHLGQVIPAGLHQLLCTRMLATRRCAIPLPLHLRYPFPCDLALQRLNQRRQVGSSATTDPSPPADDCPRYKWPSLEESYQRLTQDKAPAPQHANHDARGDVERCRAVLVAILAAPSHLGSGFHGVM